MEGFSYCGTHCSEFGIRYIPSAENRMLNMPDFTQSEETVTNRDGSYYYGEQAKPREFTVECFFQGITMDTFERMTQWISRKTYGELIFDDRPFAYYMAKPMKKPSAKVYSFVSPSGEQLYEGTITFYFKAFDPHGFMKYVTYSGEDVDHAEEHCGIVEESMMPDAPDVTTRDFLVYNPGTEKCPMTIRIGGTAPSGLTIENLTNGDVCKIKSLPPSGYLEIDGKAGKVSNLGAGFDGLAFEMHDEGYITLEPCVPYTREAMLQSGESKTSSNSTSHEINAGKESQLEFSLRGKTTIAGNGNPTPSNIHTISGEQDFIIYQNGNEYHIKTKIPLFGDDSIGVYDTITTNVPSGCDKKVIQDGSVDEDFSIFETLEHNVNIEGEFYFQYNGIKDAVPPLSDYEMGLIYSDSLERLAVEDVTGVTSGTIQGIGIDKEGNVLFCIPRVRSLDALRRHQSVNPLTIWYKSTKYSPDKDIRVNKVIKNWSTYNFDVGAPWGTGRSYGGEFMALLERITGQADESKVGDIYCTHFTASSQRENRSVNRIAVDKDGFIYLNYGNFYGDQWAYLSEMQAFFNAQIEAGTPVMLLYRLISPTYQAYEPTEIFAEGKHPDVITSNETSSVIYFAETNQIEVNGIHLTNEHVGQYININNTWHKILFVHSTTLATVDEGVTVTSTESTTIGTVNHIVISGDNINLNKLEIEYTPMLR